MTSSDGFVSVAFGRALVGLEGVMATPLRPAGKIIIDGVLYCTEK